jgi:hypothetical protein
MEPMNSQSGQLRINSGKIDQVTGKNQQGFKTNDISVSVPEKIKNGGYPHAQDALIAFGRLSASERTSKLHEALEQKYHPSLQNRLDALNEQFNIRPPITLRLIRGEKSRLNTIVDEKLNISYEIVINTDLDPVEKSAPDILVHEFGHGLYNVKSMINSTEWQDLYLMSLKCSDPSDNKTMYNQLFDETYYMEGASVSAGHPFEHPVELFASSFHKLYRYQDKGPLAVTAGEKRFYDNVESFFRKNVFFKSDIPEPKGFSREEGVNSFCDLIDNYVNDRTKDSMKEPVWKIFSGPGRYNTFDLVTNTGSRLFIDRGVNGLSKETAIRLRTTLNSVLFDQKFLLARKELMMDPIVSKLKGLAAKLPEK